MSQMSVLILVKTVCKGCQQMAEVALSKERVKKKKSSFEPVHEILLLIAYASNEDSEEHQHSLPRLSSITDSDEHERVSPDLAGHNIK